MWVKWFGPGIVVVVAVACGDINPIPSEADAGFVGDDVDASTGVFLPGDTGPDAAGCFDACGDDDVVACDEDDDCSDLDPCTTASCEAGACVVEPLADGDACDDGNACTVADACSDGVCVGAARTCANEQDGNDCTSEVCDPSAGKCVVVTREVGPCDDGNKCTVGDECAPGGVCSPGSPKSCGSCTKCESKTGSCIGYAPGDAFPCDDGNSCTDQDICKFSTCEGEPIDCDDDSPCTDGGGCKDGACLPETPKTCNDSNPCTSDFCDNRSGSCKYTPNSAPCEDGNLCTTDDQCTAGGCATGAPVDCDDDNDCTSDTCDAASGCQYSANSGQCDDGKACTTGDVCVGLVCKGSVRSCDDGDECTIDTCLEPGGCLTAPSGPIACDDGDACTSPDACATGSCTGKPIACDDGLACTVDACDGEEGCSHDPLDGHCVVGGACYASGAGDPEAPCGVCVPNLDAFEFSPATGVPCSGTGPCAPVGTCDAGECVALVTDCDDESPCTSDACDPLSGACKHSVVAGFCQIAGACVIAQATSATNTCLMCDPNKSTSSWSPRAAACDDGSPCTVGDSCVAGACTAGSASPCDDGLPCTMDLCDAASGACTHPPVAGTCLIDGQCRASGTFDPLNSCRRCQPSVAANVWTPALAGTPCADGDACTVNDVCSGGSCVGGGPMACDDGLPCTADACFEGTCEHVQVAGTCLIDGVCWAAMGPDPTSTCRRCDPAKSATAWSPLADGSTCPNGKCSAGTCEQSVVCNFDGVCSGRETCGNCSPDCGAVGDWTSLAPLTELESPDGDESFSFSFDGLELYFGSMRPGSYGSVDLWVARRPTLSSPFGNIKNVQELNSSGADLDPELSRDGLEIFFTSNRVGNLYTIQRATRDSTAFDFGAPVALPDLGGGFKAHAPRLSADGKTLYFVRYDDQGRTDIWYANRSDVGGPFGAPVKSDWSGANNELSPAFTVSELEMYFTISMSGSENAAIYRRVRNSRSVPFGDASTVPMVSQSPGHNATFTVAPDGLFAVYKRQGLGVQQELWKVSRSCLTP